MPTSLRTRPSATSVDSNIGLPTNGGGQSTRLAKSVE